MEEFYAYYDDIQFVVEVVNYTPYRYNRRGHIDNWSPDDQEEIEIKIFDDEDKDVTDSVSEYIKEVFTKLALEKMRCKRQLM